MKKFETPKDYENEPSYYVQIFDHYTGEPTARYCFAKSQTKNKSYVEIYEKTREMFNIKKNNLQQFMKEYQELM